MALASSVPDTLGGRIRRIRRNLGLTQNEFAGRLRSREGKKPDPVSVSRWERDANPPTMHYLRQIAALGDTTIGALYDGDGR